MSPCYLLCGDETYLKTQALEKIVDAIVPAERSSLNLFYIEGETENVEEIRQSILTAPLIPGRKVVVVKNSQLLHSRASLPQMAARAVEVLESDPIKAAKQFGLFLKKAGWALEDLSGGNWKKISEADWRKALDSEEFEEREKWIPRMIELCEKFDFSEQLDRSEGQLDEVLRRGLPEGNCLILTAEAVDKRKALFKAISEQGVVLEFLKVKNDAGQRDLAGRISRELLGKSGKAMSSGAFLELGKKTGFDLKKLTGEIEKLVTYSGEKDLIDEKDIGLLIERAYEDSVFSLTAAICEKKSGKALEILRDLLEEGIHHLMILTMIAREFRLLLYARLLRESGKAGEISPDIEFPQFQKSVVPKIKEWAASENGLAELKNQHPYVLYKLFRNTSRFSPAELISRLEYLLETDLGLKTTGQDPKLLMEKTIVLLCSR